MILIRIPILLLATILISSCGNSGVVTPGTEDTWPPKRPQYQTPPPPDLARIDEFKFYMRQGGGGDGGAFGLGTSFFADFNSSEKETFWGTISAIYYEAKENSDEYYTSLSVSAMGDTGIVEFLPNLIVELETGDTHLESMAALKKMNHPYSVYAMIQVLNDDDEVHRGAAARNLGEFEFYENFPTAKFFAIDAMMKSMENEPVDWVLERKQSALDKLLDL